MKVRLFGMTILLGAALLFMVQPMIARMVLPILGGAPSVWTSCMLFFQAVLLAGYAYAHVSTRLLPSARSGILHLLLLVSACFLLPTSFIDNTEPLASSSPVPWLIGRLLWVCLPFVMLSASSPLLQHYFAAVRDHRARDPYFLYAAGNIGSIMGLLLYPLVLEPSFSMRSQARLWSGLFVLYVLLTACCVLILRRDGSTSLPLSQTEPLPYQPEKRTNQQEPAWRQKLHWVMLAFVPSSLMLGLTSYITTDIASVPMLWVPPLALYLLSYVFTFAPGPPPLPGLARNLTPLAVVALLLLLVFRINNPFWLIILTHLTGFFVLAMACHGTLARKRPAVRFLTGYYLLIACGGVLGGLFNGMIAPALFNVVLEYPLALVFAVLVCLPLLEVKNLKPGQILLKLAPGLIAPAWVALYSMTPFWQNARPGEDHLDVAIMTAPLLLLCFLFRKSAGRLVPVLATLLVLGAMTYQREVGETLFRARGFFGIHRVTYNKEENANLLFHGTTAHGMQKRDPAVGRSPSGYYHYSGPIGRIFETSAKDLYEVAVVGLGSGGLAGYAEKGQRFTFFELDPLVVQIAENTDYFTFLADARLAGAEIDIITGDARLSLHSVNRQFDLLILDAFNSDAIPIHLLTREALQIYQKHLNPNGIIMFHITNEYSRLAFTLGDLAADAGLLAFHSIDGVSSYERVEGKFPSEWVLMTHNQDLSETLKADRWRQLMPRPGWPVWSDDFHNILDVFL